MDHRETVVDTGIFKTTVCEPDDDPAAFAEWLVNDIKGQPTLKERLAAARQEAAAILTAHGCCADGRRAPSDSAPPVCHDASVLIGSIDMLMACWDSDSKDETAERIFWIGATLERMRARPFEKAARGGRRQLEGASKGGRARSRRGADPFAVHARIEALKAELGPSAKMDTVCGIAGREFRIHPRTAYRHHARVSAGGAGHCQ